MPISINAAMADTEVQVMCRTESRSSAAQVAALP
jgi:hypothetical protein